MQEGLTGEKEEILLIVLWARIFSKNSSLPLPLTCCKAATPQGSLDSCSDSSKGQSAQKSSLLHINSGVLAL